MWNLENEMNLKWIKVTLDTLNYIKPCQKRIFHLFRVNFAWHKIVVYFIYFFPLKLLVPYIAPFPLQQLIIVIYSAFFFFAALYTSNMIKNCIFLFWKGVPGAQGQSGPPGDRVSVINSFPLNTIQYQCEIPNSKWQEATSWLFTSVSEDLNLVPPRTNPASVQSSTRTLDCQIVSRTRWPLGHATSNR